jgi:hypothetical protein
MINGSNCAALALALIAFSAVPAAAEKKAKKPNEAAQTSSLIAGTVFRPPGFALPGAEVEVTQDADGKPKKIKAVSDARGEFAVRVPPVPMKYKVDVKCNGYQAQQKSVAIEGEQRKDLTFQLEPVEK